MPLRHTHGMPSDSRGRPRTLSPLSRRRNPRAFADSRPTPTGSHGAGATDGAEGSHDGHRDARGVYAVSRSLPTRASEQDAQEQREEHVQGVQEWGSPERAQTDGKPMTVQCAGATPCGHDTTRRCWARRLCHHLSGSGRATPSGARPCGDGDPRISGLWRCLPSSPVRRAATRLWSPISSCRRLHRHSCGCSAPMLHGAEPQHDVLVELDGRMELDGAVAHLRPLDTVTTNGQAHPAQEVRAERTDSVELDGGVELDRAGAHRVLLS